MTKVLERFAEITHRISVGGGWIAIIAMWAMTAIIGAEIISRTFFKTSLVFVLDISEWLLVAVVLMGLAWTLKAGGHVRIGLLSSHLSQRNQSWLLVCLSAVGAVTFVFVAVYAWQGMVNYYVMGVRTATLMRFPLWWAWAPLFVGSALLALQFVATIAENLVSLRSTHERGKGWSPAWFIGLAVILIGLVAFLLIWPEAPRMSEWLVLVVVLILVFGFIFGSTWIFLSLTITGIFAMIIFTPYPVGPMTTRLLFNSNSSFVLTCLPLFIFMGELLFRSGASQYLYSGISPWVERIPGRLLHSNILACTVFAAVSGSSAATCATIGTVAVPELKKLGYEEGISLGSLAGAGTLGLLIPPSIVMIVYGAITTESIGQLFLGGIIPGLMLSALFMLYIGFQAIRRPSIAPPSISFTWGDRLKSIPQLLPIFVVIGLVLGLIYAGITTPTEAGAVGAICAFATVILYRNLSWRVIKEASWNAIRTSCMIMMVMAAALLLSSSMGYLLIPQWLAAVVEASGLDKYVILAILCLIYVGLGCLFDGVSMMVLTLPIIYPMIIVMGFNGIWFGVLLTVLIETAQITPPVGFNLYVLQTISGRSIGMITRNTIPFFFCLLLGVVILIIFPDLALILPNAMIAAR